MANSDEFYGLLNLNIPESINGFKVQIMGDVLNFGTPTTVNDDYEDFFSCNVEDSPVFRDAVPVSVPVPGKIKKIRTNIISGERYSCSKCNKSFTNISNLKAHKQIHTGEKKFKCSKCDKAFFQLSNLKGHERTHTGERPFVCDICKKAFSRKSHLDGHLKIHNNEISFPCSICSNSYSSQTLLQKHVEKHHRSKSYSCSVCRRTFDNKSSLDIHLITHKKERPLRCKLCAAAFRSADDLNAHKKLHVKEDYLYSCIVCGKGFKILTCCQKHVDICMLEYHVESCMLESHLVPSPSASTYNPEKKTGLDLFLNSLGNSDFEFKGIESASIPTEHCQLFQIDDSQEGPNGLCKMELLEGTLEDGIEFEDEQRVIFFNEEEESYSIQLPVLNNK